MHLSCSFFTQEKSSRLLHDIWGLTLIKYEELGAKLTRPGARCELGYAENADAKGWKLHTLKNRICQLAYSCCLRNMAV